MIYSSSGIKMIIFRSVLLLLILFYPHPSHSHNGAVAITVPVDADTSFSQPPIGVTVKAGKGETMRAGPGLRQGLWQILDNLDGLAHSEVNTIAEDNSG